ncbi:hypothetical protein ES702_02651 [subsurface metagenome]
MHCSRIYEFTLCERLLASLCMLATGMPTSHGHCKRLRSPRRIAGNRPSCVHVEAREGGCLWWTASLASRSVSSKPTQSTI